MDLPIPGSPGSYVANGSEHDPIGDTTHLPQRHLEMTNRRFSKLSLLENESYEKLNAKAEICIMPWGGSKGPGFEAFKKLQEKNIDTLILGCTHYSIMADTIQSVLPANVKLVFSGETVGQKLSHYLNENKLIRTITSDGHVEFYVSDFPQKFNELGITNLMLDLKLKDIPQTIYRSIIALDDIKFGYLTIHGQGGREMIEQAKKQDPGNTPYYCTIDSIYNLSFNENQFETILIMGVFEYLDLPDIALKNIKNITKQGGNILVSFPNQNSPMRKLSNLIYYILNKPTPFASKMFTLREVKSMAQKLNLSIICFIVSTIFFFLQCFEIF